MRQTLRLLGVIVKSILFSVVLYVVVAALDFFPIPQVVYIIIYFAGGLFSRVLVSRDLPAWALFLTLVVLFVPSFYVLSTIFFAPFYFFYRLTYRELVPNPVIFIPYTLGVFWQFYRARRKDSIQV